jgi:hypothetical protein
MKNISSLGGTQHEIMTMTIPINGQINGALKLGPALQNIILCEANRLKINSRDRFVRRVADMLKCVPQPPSRNDVIMATRSVLRDIPTSEVLIHGDPSDEDNFEYRRRY